ncbi:hypothetical protein AK830_g8766 [Neonectria ditissima]|uniref:Protein kinase domain-containing protein n=1 Tax=Neonectria ditissima TaxID=78410 RepID=A0A0P7BDL7_9HYPO|nr:hypothetical protein AK830_g8766 [Neonectria ditissima]
MIDYKRIEKLATDIEKAFDVASDEESFLPCDKFEEFVTESVVKETLETASLEDVQSLLQFVLSSAKKIFLTLVMLTSKNEEKISMLREFRHRGVDDASLPIGFKNEEGGRGWYGYSLDEPSDPKRQFSCPVDKIWGRTDRKNFASYQWCFIAPIFNEGQFRFRFHGRTVLPYLDVAPKPTSSGFFGEVSRIGIHPAHISPPNSEAGSVAVALKKARHGDDLARFFDKETDNLDRLKQKAFKSTHLIQPIAAYTQKNDRCLMFPWAHGGTLSQYWKDNPHKSLHTESLKWVISQFSGICSALKELHQDNCRHGDLKPDNILWFKEGIHDGSLKIADLGLATFHSQDAHTNLRRGIQTMTPSGTRRYEPPETDEHRDDPGEPRSRAYDVWSMGCMMLELLIWLVYGSDAVTKFGNSTSDYFWEVYTEPDVGRQYRLHRCVTICLQNLDENLKDETAYKALFELVQARLLVVRVDQNNKSSPDCREIAAEVDKAMEAIKKRCYSDPNYLVPIQPKVTLPNLAAKPSRRPATTKNGALAPEQPSPQPRGLQTRLPERPLRTEEFDGTVKLERRATGIDNPESQSLWVPKSVQEQEFQSSKLNDIWVSTPDSKFATAFLKLVEWDRVKPRQTEVGTNLCLDCSNSKTVRLLESGHIPSKLQPTCDLCRMLMNVLDRVGIKPSTGVKLRQAGAMIGIEGGPDLLSIYCQPSTMSLSSNAYGFTDVKSSGSNIPSGTQIGLPTLLEQGSKEQFTLLKEWIKVCDSTHNMCRRSVEYDVWDMPTRLIDVEQDVRLVDTTSIKSSRYAALSHCWGQLKKDEMFCTYKSNLAQFQKSIDFSSLPQTFKDAVTVARGLGLKYIWIDSLCIIQDDEVDWESESAKMEQVFSSAYCTISASSAKSSLEGFLVNRPSRPCVQVEMKNSELLYVCPAIDDFRHDVELGEINKRGWVLQERALSRRSIHFTSSQVYWECGAGVHCETLGRLNNSKAAFLGDANFPKSALEYYRDGRQMLIQDLYERYSRLAFSKSSDRSVAILGLQKRLARAFKTEAEYGFFAAYFSRGILWKRDQVQGMKRITQPPGRRVPSWSWFSRGGMIKYMELKFERITWLKDDFETYFTRQLATDSEQASGSKSGGGIPTIRGLARKMITAKEELLVHATFDDDLECEVDDLRCVAIGRDKPVSGLKDLMFYLLVIQRIGSVLGEVTYERVGVASLMSQHVASEGSWVCIQ